MTAELLGLPLETDDQELIDFLTRCARQLYEEHVSLVPREEFDRYVPISWAAARAIGELRARKLKPGRLVYSGGAMVAWSTDKQKPPSGRYVVGT